MRLAPLMDRCIALERGAAALYRRFAAETDAGDPLRDTWRHLAEEEDEHAAQLVVAAATVDPRVAHESRVEGWEEALTRAEGVLARAAAGAVRTSDERLGLALDLERSEIDVVRRIVLATAHEDLGAAGATGEHARELAALAMRHSADEAVTFKAALVRAHGRIAPAVEPE